MLMDTIDPWSVSEESMNLVDVEWRIQVVVAMFEKRFYPLGRFAHGSSCLGFSRSGFHSDPKGVQAFRVNDLFFFYKVTESEIKRVHLRFHWGVKRCILIIVPLASNVIVSYKYTIEMKSKLTRPPLDTGFVFYW